MSEELVAAEKREAELLEQYLAARRHCHALRLQQMAAGVTAATGKQSCSQKTVPVVHEQQISPSCPAASVAGKNRSWADLSDAERAAASKIGYSSSTWGERIATAIRMKYWGTLSESERSAAQLLGYNEECWNTELVNQNARTQVQTASGVANVWQAVPPVSTRGKDKRWAQMTAAERQAAAKIGYAEISWDTGAFTATTSKLWRDLLPEERGGAEFLGYTEKEWDAEMES